MKKLNKIVQTIILVALILAGIASLINREFVFYILALLIPLGFSQYVGSLIGVIRKGTASKFFIHFVVSTVTLLLLIGYNAFYSMFPHGYEDVLITICSIVCVLLAIFYYVLTFSNREIRLSNHSVFDL